MPSVMAALPNIGGALYSTPQSLADAHYYFWRGTASLPETLKPRPRCQNFALITLVSASSIWFRLTSHAFVCPIALPGPLEC